MICRASYFTALLLCSFFAGAQELRLQVLSEGRKSTVGRLNYQKRFTTRQAAYNEVQRIVETLHYKGYLLATVDTLYADSTTVTARISENKVFKTAYLRLGNLNPDLASKLGISEKLWFNKPFRYKEVARSYQKILQYYENNGYPFASVELDSIATSEEELRAQFHVEKNKFFKIDSIRIEGTAKVNRSFLNRYLAVREGMPYNEEALAAVPQKLRQLPFLFERQPQVVRLTDKSNKLYLFLDKKDASQFDGIIGLLPDAENARTVITGDVKLKLVNGILRNGETFDLEWRRLQTQTQDFKGRVIYPYLFGSPVGVDYALKIYRKDTTFVDINNDFGVQYYFRGLNHVKVFYKQRNTNLISTSGLDFATVLPDYADIETQAYGIGVVVERLDYRFNPRRGIALQANVQTGNRTIKKNPKINGQAYDGLVLRSAQYQGDGLVSAFFPLGGNHVLRLGVQAASVFGNASLFRNELFRIGGLKTLRGFDEESIFASTYVIPTLEYRFLFGQNSNLLLFAEGAWYETSSAGSYRNDTPVSVGAGINFETRAGILSLNYGLGSQAGNGFDLRSGKIHFGLTALF